MKKGLVIGAAGFVGNYLIRELYANGIEVYATKFSHNKFDTPYAKVFELDIMDKEADRKSVV